MLLFYSAHHHAQMASLYDYSDPLGLDRVLDGLSNLGGEPFLNLEAAGKGFDEARNFAQADYFSIWDIGDVHLAEERQKVMLAEAEHFDVFHDHHFVVVDGEQRLAQQRFGIVLVSLDQKLHGFGHASRSAGKALAIGILSKANDHFAD